MTPPRNAAFDVAAIRAHFPALERRHRPLRRARRLTDARCRRRRHPRRVTCPLSNRGTATDRGRNAEDIVGQCRAALGDLLGADADEVIFGRSMTELTFDMARTLSAQVAARRRDRRDPPRPRRQRAAVGDRRAAAGAVVRWADFDPAPPNCPCRTSRNS